jgi:LPXTG-motif cell wall-anchored protein
MRRARWSTIVFALAYVAFVVGVFLALGGAAYAQQDPASDQYGSKVQNVFTPPTASTPPSNTSSVASDIAETLPNTGLSLLAAALVGGALLAVGIALRRREQRDGGQG